MLRPFKATNFERHEFACNDGHCKHCGGVAPMDGRIVLRCDVLRDKLGFPLKVNSGFRCFKHNEKIGGATNSYHKKGLAVDLTAGSKQRIELLWMQARKDPVIQARGGLILYPWGIHIDIRGLCPFSPRESFFEDRR